MTQTAATPARQSRPTPARQRVSLWRLLRANLYDLSLLVRESALVLIGFAIIVALGSLYFGVTTSLPLRYDVYEAVKLLLFVSGQPLPSDFLGDLLFFIAPLLGLALLTQGVLNFGRLVLDKSSRREAWQVSLASTFRRHVIVCGLGHVGFRVVSQLLEAGYHVVIIERDWSSEFVSRALSLRVPVVAGDAREPNILRQARVKHARAVVAGVNDDLMNIEIALAARATNANVQTILRVFSEELDRNLERSFGLNTAFSTSALAAPTLTAAAVSHQIDYVLTLEQNNDLLGVERLTLQPEDQPPATLTELEVAWGVRALAHLDTGGKPARRPNGQLAIGDQLTLIGALPSLEAIRERVIDNSVTMPLTGRRPRHSAELLDRVIVCGLGKVGYRVVTRLARLTPRPQIVVVHLDDTQSFAQQISGLESVTTIIGDASDPQVLQRAGIQHATTVAAVTSNDLVNLQIGLAARRERSSVHLVLRVFSDALANELSSLFNIATTFSTSELAAPTLASAAILPGISQAFFSGGQLYAALPLLAQAGDPLSGQAIQSLRLSRQALVIGLRRKGESLTLPPLDTTIAPGDELTLLGRLDALAGVRER